MSNTSHDHKHVQNPLITDNSQIQVTIPWAEVDKEYQKQLRRVAKTAKTDGFRVGKVPLHLVEQMVDTAKLYETALNPIFPKYYSDALTAAKKLPISQPEVEPISMEPGKDWVFLAHFAERPEIKLGKYQEIVKKAKAEANKELEKKQAELEKEAKAAQKEAKSDDKAAKPAEKAQPLSDEQKDDFRINKTFQALIEAIKVPVPEILVRQETNRTLQQLGDQLRQFGLDAKKYLESRKMTEHELTDEYTAHALGTLQVEFLMAEIAKDQKITVTDPELEKALDTAAGGKLTAEQRQNPDYRGYVFSSLLKQKVISYLLAA